MIRVELPAHLRTLAGVKGEVTLDVPGLVTQRSVLDALEAKYPMLAGDDSRAWDVEAKGVFAILCVRRGHVA